MACSPLFCWVYVLFRFFGRPDPVLAPFGLDLGGFVGAIVDVEDAHVPTMLVNGLEYCWLYVDAFVDKNLVPDGLVGLRKT